MLAVVLEDVRSSLSHSCSEIKEAVEKANWGTRTLKDFLKPDSDSPVINRGTNGRNRRCLAIYMNKMASNMQQQFRSSKCCTTVIRNYKVILIYILTP